VTREEAASVLEDALRDIPVTRRPLDDSGMAEAALNELEGEGGWEQGLRYAADSCWVGDEVEEVGRAIEHAMREAPSDLSRAVIPFGIFPTEPFVDTALASLGLHNVNLYATWTEPEDDGPNVEWVRRSISGLSPWIGGHYVGESDLLAQPDRIRKSFSPANWERLQRVLSEYDPDGRLHTFLASH
jgi:FAD/FMN-containing dehydrogenase